MRNSVSVKKFIQAIEKLPSDEPQITPGRWYKTQKEHWLGWLREYHGPGAYNRASSTKRDARFAYNHIVQPKMLLWLIEAVGVRPELVTAARRSASQAASMMEKSAKIRQSVPWSEIEKALWAIEVDSKQE